MQLKKLVNREEIFPEDAQKYKYMALWLHDKGNFDQSIKYLETAINIFPEYADAYFYLGVSLFQNKNLIKSIESYKKALEYKSDHSETYYNLGIALKRKEDLGAAMDSFKKAIKNNPEYFEAYNDLGVMLLEQSELDAAIESFKKAIEVKPEYVEAHYNLGNALKDKGDFGAATNSYKQALKIKPDLAQALLNIGIMLLEKGETDAALLSFEQAVNIKPDYADAYYNIGIALHENGETDASIASYKKAIKIKPDHAPAYHNISVVFTSLGDLASAIENCDKAMQVDPNHRKSKFLKAQLLLNHHEFEIGWSLFIANRDLAKEVTLDAGKRAERWQGSCLKGKNIQVYAAQGVGDELFYSSCIPDLIRKCPRGIYLECDPRLQPLFARSFPEIFVYGKARTKQLAEVFKSDDTPIENHRFDYSIPIDWLPYFFRNQIEDFPVRDAFLTPDPKLVKKWAKRLRRLGKHKKIGISWRGGGKNIHDISSIPLQNWKSLLSVDAFFINLQYGNTSEEVAQFRAENNNKIYDWKDNNASLDLDNQAALISELDLVISIDNATVQSCVALGTEVWNLLVPHVNFLWMENGTSSSPLCPHMRLFKKNHKNSWQSVLIQVEDQLREKIG